MTMSKVTQVVNGVEIAYDDVGSGPVVVLLHGYPFNRSMWRGQVAVLQQNHRVIVPDLRGHGESAIVPGPSTMELMAGDVAGLLDSLDIAASHYRRAFDGRLCRFGFLSPVSFPSAFTDSGCHSGARRQRRSETKSRSASHEGATRRNGRNR